MAAEIALIQSRISAPSGDRITVTQAKTYKLANGLEVDEFDAVVVDFVAANYYYTDPFDRGNIIPPACFAISMEPGGMVPSENSPDVQAGACASCWANQFGTNGKGKACQNTRLLAVLPLDADISTPFAILKVSPTAIRAFDSYAGNVARKHSMPVRAMVTQFSFSEDQYSSVRFTEMGFAEKDLVLLANGRKEEALARLLTEPNVVVAEDNIGHKKETAARKPPGKAAPKATKAAPRAAAR